MSTDAKRRTNPHAAPVGWAGALLGRFHVTGVFWFQFHRFGVRVLPDWLMGSFVTGFTLFFTVVLIRIRRAIGHNLDGVLGEAGWWRRQVRAFKTLHEFAFCLTERYERLETERDFRIEVENKEAWERATDGGHGAIMVTGHVGNWELGATLPGSIEGRHVHLVREEELDPRAQAMIADLLSDRLGAHVTMHFAGDDPALALRLREALEDGEIVALQADRPRSVGKSVTESIFGRPFDLPLGPLALARLSKVCMVPAFMLREGRRSYRLCLREPIHVSSTGDREGDLADAAKRLASEIEYAIRREPHQWFCWRRVWPDRARG